MLYGVNAKEIQINPILTLSPWLSRQVCWCLWFCLVLLFPPFILCWWNSSQRWPAVSRRGRTLTDSSRALEEGRKAAGRAGTSLPRAHPSTEVLLPAHMRLLSNNRPRGPSFLGAHHWDTLPFLSYDKGLGRHLSHILTLWGLSISMNPQTKIFFFTN